MQFNNLHSNLVDYLMLSDSETQSFEQQATDIQRMSTLTKLNLLGLILLSKIICDLKINQSKQDKKMSIEIAILATQKAIQEVHELNAKMEHYEFPECGIASVNLMQKFLKRINAFVNKKQYQFSDGEEEVIMTDEEENQNLPKMQKR